MHLYADDIIVHSDSSILSQADDELQAAFQQLQASRYDLMLGRDAKKTKFLFRARSQISDIVGIIPLEERKLKKYHAISTWVSGRLIFRVLTEHLMKKLNVKLAFYYWNRACLHLAAW